MVLKKASNKKSAFTIIEVLLVIFLIGLVAGLFAVNFNVLIKAIGKKRPEKVLYNALCEARYQTIQEHAPVFLKFDKDKSAFLIYKDKPDKPLAELAVEKGIEVVFEIIPPNEYRGARFQPPNTRSLEAIEKVAFFPDGSSTPVVVTLSEDRSSLKFKSDPLACGLTSV